MDKPGRVFIYFDSRFHQRHITCTRRFENKFFIGYVRRYYTNVNPCFRRVFERCFHRVVENQVRRCYIDVILCSLNYVHIYVFADVFRIVRAVRIRLNKAVVLFLVKQFKFVGAESFVIFITACGILPHR